MGLLGIIGSFIMRLHVLMRLRRNFSVDNDMQRRDSTLEDLINLGVEDS